MILSNQKKRETWIFTINDTMLGPVIGTISIIFFEGNFEKVEYPFKGLYTADEWDLMGQIAFKIKEIEKMYKEIGEELKEKRCHVCGVSEGELHKGICSVGNGIYRG